MTMQEASKRYHIPMHILQEYQRWGAVRRGEKRDERLAI